jgi:hypothetical protein
MHLPKSRHTLVLLLSFTTWAASPVSAQERSRAGLNEAVVQRNSPTPSSSDSPKMLTAKERLGGKWMDEQRVDNCKVPLDKRGAKPRPDACANVLSQ